MTEYRICDDPVWQDDGFSRDIVDSDIEAYGSGLISSICLSLLFAMGLAFEDLQVLASDTSRSHNATKSHELIGEAFKVINNYTVKHVFQATVTAMLDHVSDITSSPKRHPPAKTAWRKDRSAYEWCLSDKDSVCSAAVRRACDQPADDDDKYGIHLLSLGRHAWALLKSQPLSATENSLITDCIARLEQWMIRFQASVVVLTTDTALCRNGRSYAPKRILCRCFTCARRSQVSSTSRTIVFC